MTQALLGPSSATYRQDDKQVGPQADSGTLVVASLVTRW